MDENPKEVKMRLAIYGISGYLGNELVKLVSGRSDLEVVFAATSQECQGELEKASVALLALPPGESLYLVPKLLRREIRVIDLSGAYRLKNPKLYPRYYGIKHPYQKLLEEAVYGLPENNRRKIKDAKLIANPGCYATAANLGLLPLIKSGLIADASKIIVSAISGLHRRWETCQNPEKCNSL